MENQQERIIQVDIKDEMKKSFLDYSMSVIVSRALPDVRDGLKPVHRRILYTMYENGLTPEKAYRKCADTVGSVLGRYHPHGDGSVYDALVRLARDFSLRYPLVDGHGNFGSIDGDPAAAYRYTEAKMSKMAVAMLTNIEKETVDYAPNYDDRLLEPIVLPSRFPNLLVNGSMGIAVGMATNIPPHNLTEVCNGIFAMIDNPDITLDGLMEHIKGPDFPTAGIIMGYSGIRSAYATGRGKVILRGRAEIVEKPKTNREQIIITELPYVVNKARLITSIADLVKDKRIDGITNIQDYSDRDGMNIVIDIRRDANARVILNQLYSFTQLQSTEGVIMLALHNGQPKVMSLKEMMQHYIDFQCEIIERRTVFELKKAKERAHLLEGLVIAQDNIDEVISIIRSKKTIPEAREGLIERFILSEEQATAITQMTLGRLTGLERERLEKELSELTILIADLEDILMNQERVLEIIKEELGEILKKFGDERKTEIVMVSGEVDIEDLIPEEENVITLTHYGYLKRQPVDAYKLQRRGGRGVQGMDQRDEDFVEELYISSSHDYLMFFTDRGRCFRIKAYEVPESGRYSRGTNVVNILNLEDEKITAVLPVQDKDEEAYLVLMTKKGVIKRTALSAYSNVRKNGLIAINLDDDDDLTGVRITGGNDDLIIATKKGMAIRINESDARAIGRASRGVRAIRLREGDEVLGFAKVSDGDKLLTVSQDGKGRSTYPKEYRTQKRGGLGIKNFDTKKYGDVAGVRMINDDDDIIMISDDGIIIRIPAQQISVQSRYGSGVNVMRLAEGSHVVTLARSPKEEEPEETENGEETILDGEGSEVEEAGKKEVDERLLKEIENDIEEDEIDSEDSSKE